MNIGATHLMIGPNEWPGRGGSPYIEWAPIGSIYEPNSLEKLQKACQSWIHKEISNIAKGSRVKPHNT